MKNQIGKFALVLGMAGLDGHVALAALSGLFKLENVFSLAVIFMAGPSAILTAVLLDGSVRERMFAALLAGIIATIIVMFAAGIGPKLLTFLDLGVIKIFGGIAIMVIALMIMGLKIPENLPLLIMLAGVIFGVLLRLI